MKKCYYEGPAFKLCRGSWGPTFKLYRGLGSHFKTFRGVPRSSPHFYTMPMKLGNILSNFIIDKNIHK